MASHIFEQMNDLIAAQTGCIGWVAVVIGEPKPIEP
jgi:hypothetical protein